MGYAHCHYTEDQFVKVFGKIAPKIRALDSDIEIIYDTNSGQNGSYGPKLWQENPQLLKYVDAWVYHRMLRSGRSLAERRESLLHTMACKAAIKGGWKSGPEELRALVDKVQSGEVRYCPHGRPVAVRLTKYEIEKMFKRA